jgi:hypothetical protein
MFDRLSLLNIIFCFFVKIKKAYEYLEPRVKIFLKKINYKSKNCDNLECNEVIYRIYALTLKRIEGFNSSSSSSENDMKCLLGFLERVSETRFVKAHDDFQLAETSAFLEREVFAKSKRINQIPNKGYKTHI